VEWAGEKEGIGGTGGMRSGDPPVLFVTPGMYAIWMTLEALVSTVEAIDRTDCIEARGRLVMSSPPFSDSASCQMSSSNCCLRFLMQNLQTKNVIRHTTAIPPTTPPAMGPAGEGGDDCG